MTRSAFEARGSWGAVRASVCVLAMVFAGGCSGPSGSADGDDAAEAVEAQSEYAITVLDDFPAARESGLSVRDPEVVTWRVSDVRKEGFDGLLLYALDASGAARYVVAYARAGSVCLVFGRPGFQAPPEVVAWIRADAARIHDALDRSLAARRGLEPTAWLTPGQECVARIATGTALVLASWQVSLVAGLVVGVAEGTVWALADLSNEDSSWTDQMIGNGGTLAVAGLIKTAARAVVSSAPKSVVKSVVKSVASGLGVAGLAMVAGYGLYSDASQPGATLASALLPDACRKAGYTGEIRKAHGVR